MRITYIHQYFKTPGMAGGTRSYEFARRLVERGHEVHVVTSDPAGDRTRTSTESGIVVHWLPVPYDNAMSYRRRLWAFLGFVCRSAAVAGRLRPNGVSVSLFERALLRFGLIDRLKIQTLALRNRIAPILGQGVPRWCRGRVDTFNPYKAIQFNWQIDRLPHEELIGASDFPSLWNQRPREGLHLHWDGDNTSVRERNVSAAFGAGATPEDVDLPRIVAPAPGPFFGARLMLVLAALAIAAAVAGFQFSPETPEGPAPLYGAHAFPRAASDLRDALRAASRCAAPRRRPASPHRRARRSRSEICRFGRAAPWVSDLRRQGSGRCSNVERVPAQELYGLTFPHG